MLSSLWTSFREAGIERVVYFSMINADTFSDVPHAAAKFAAEQAVRRLSLPTTILRPNYFFQNDLLQKAPLNGKPRRYVMPIGNVGVTMVDARDIAEVAARELMRREQSTDPLPTEIIEIVGPEKFTGETMAKLWSQTLGEPVTYAGDELRAAEQVFRASMPTAPAYDMTLMFRGFLQDGMLGDPTSAHQLVRMLGRPLRRYQEFAKEAAAQWRAEVSDADEQAAPRRRAR